MRASVVSLIAHVSSLTNVPSSHFFAVLSPGVTPFPSLPQSAGVKSLVRNRWHLAVTLMNNPSLVAFRKHHRERSQTQSKEGTDA